MKTQESEDFPAIFAYLRSLLATYSPPLAITANFPGRYEISSIKDIVIAGKKKQALPFASIIIRKSHVGFYFMPVYTHPPLLTSIPPELKKLLKGKSCFRIRALDAALLRQLGELTAKGFRLYKREGFIS